MQEERKYEKQEDFSFYLKAGAHQSPPFQGMHLPPVNANIPTVQKQLEIGDIGLLLQDLRKKLDTVDKSKAGRELAIVKTKLQEANFWLGEAFDIANPQTEQ